MDELTELQLREIEALARAEFEKSYGTDPGPEGMGPFEPSPEEPDAGVVWVSGQRPDGTRVSTVVHVALFERAGVRHARALGAPPTADR